MSLKNLPRKLKIYLIAIAIYYLLIFFFFLLIYPSYRYPGNPVCGLLQGNYDGLLGSFIYLFANSGELPCLIVVSGELLLKPMTIFFEPGAFIGIELVGWIVTTSVYVFIFFVAYKLMLFIRNKRKKVKTSC